MYKNNFIGKITFQIFEQMMWKKYEFRFYITYYSKINLKWIKV